ncbi:hypothetical protein BKA63DRAFT_517498 [Paraphoma chrysanthemicola]|nr:hypothetical protein BKA63DRAFT_517498 [Paraphoma chrysanthemicola]
MLCCMYFKVGITQVLALHFYVTLPLQRSIPIKAQSLPTIHLGLTNPYLSSAINKRNANSLHAMRLSFTAILACAAPIFGQSITPTPTTTDFWGPPWATTDPAKWSSIYNSLVSEGKIPSTLTQAPWATGGWGPGYGPWGGGRGPGGPGGPGHWGGPNGPGPWGSSNYGPWSEWSTRTDWRNGPWTAWNGAECPGSDWPVRWTAGPWSTKAPWTSWSACSARTTATTVVTTTINGSAVVTSAYGLQVAAASASQVGSAGGGVPAATAGVGAAIGAAILGLAVGL